MSIIEEIESYLEQYRGKQNQTRISYHESTINSDSETSFKKAWTKLSALEKLNRLMNYHRIMVGTYNLSRQASISLQKLFYQNYESMTDAVIEYDASSAKIVNIKGLKKDPDADNFFLETACSERPIGLKVDVHFKRLNLSKQPKQPMSTTQPKNPTINLNIRKKPVIIKKID